MTQTRDYAKGLVNIQSIEVPLNPIPNNSKSLRLDTPVHPVHNDRLKSTARNSADYISLVRLK